MNIQTFTALQSKYRRGVTHVARCQVYTFSMRGGKNELQYKCSLNLPVELPERYCRHDITALIVWLYDT